MFVEHKMMFQFTQSIDIKQNLMSNLKIEGKELRAIGYPQAPVISIAIEVMEKNFRHTPHAEAMEILRAILQSPNEYANDPVLNKIAVQLVPKPPAGGPEIPLNNSGIPFNVYGSEHIEDGAMQQMHTAAKLPIAVAGALMPDAHSGYGLPIGGVLATHNAVIPYGVGVDIGCRMCLSIFPMDPAELSNKEQYFARELNEATLFGTGQHFDKPSDHPVMENEAFYRLPILRDLHGRAWKQLGSSGSGNHFVEFGEVTLAEADPVLGVEAGSYLGLLSHSGSRALGANIANHYTKIAKQKRRLPPEASNLAWLDLSEEEGIEYWLAMNLAGDYASACHHIIHQKIAKQLGHSPLKMVENHHNFAWKETFDGKEVIVHRKGATPAGKDVLGIIPGSMSTAGYIVKGKGESKAVHSASHGAGRKMSRTAAIKAITHEALREELKNKGIKLIGGGLDEAPFAYKDIEVVMQSQRELVDVVGKFTPRIVKMDGAKHKPRGKKKHEISGE